MEQIALDAPLVYVVDDDKLIARLIATNLGSQGYQVKEFYHGQELLDIMGHGRPDLIILDVVMPGVNGVEVAKCVRRRSMVPIMMLSGQSNLDCRAVARDVGAEDYMVKPFAARELLTRVGAILSRPRPADIGTYDSRYRCGDLCVDLDSGVVTLQERPVKLTAREWGILQVLAEYAGQPVASSFLLQEVWGPEYEGEGDYIRAYITRLRRKLEPDPKHPRYILLERGVGYRLAEPG